jgi:hypothetical protein
MTNRQAFSADLLTDLSAAWRRRGAAAIEQMLNESPSNFVKVCTSGGGFRLGLGG